MINVSVPPEFRRSISLHHYAVGDYVDGVWVDGAVTDSIISASVQPLNAGDYKLLPEGNEKTKGWKVFWNGNFDLGNNVTGQKPDEITVNGLRHKLIHKEEWQDNGYTAGTFLELR